RSSTKMVDSFIRYVHDFLDFPDLIMYMILPQNDTELRPWEKRLVERAYHVHLETNYSVNFSTIKANYPSYSKVLDIDPGNWNGGWTGSDPKGTGMHQLYAVAQCGSLLRDAEAKRGRKYDRV